MKRNNNNNNDNSNNTIEIINNKNSINNGNTNTTTTTTTTPNNTTETLDKTLKNQKYVNEEESITKTILASVPKESQITLARFEGPNIAIYTKNPKFSLTELTYYLSSLSKTLKKRFIVRTDNSIRLEEDETRSIVAKILPKDVIVSAVFCDDATGEVVLEVNKPEAIDSETIINIAQSTGWIAHLRRSSHISSMSIKNIHTILKSSSKERTCFLRE